MEKRKCWIEQHETSVGIQAGPDPMRVGSRGRVLRNFPLMAGEGLFHGSSDLWLVSLAGDH